VTQLLRGLKDIGATNVNAGRRAGLGGRQALKELEEVYPTEEDNGNIRFPLSYEVLWIYARTV
jgi:malonyl-CoA O-methyltransferase